MPDGSPFEYYKLPAVWGGYGEKVTRPEDITAAISRAAATGKSAVIEIEVVESEDTYSPGTIECFKIVTA